ncbi:MAG: RluA family pseudouridine synthase [Anaerolineae bacterium]|nr:RluA family pseudouridine synthase [Anaerolineae bacterium]
MTEAARERARECTREFALSAGAGGERIDKFLAQALPEFSRAALQRLIEEGEVTVGGETVRVAYKVRKGDAIVVRVPAPKPSYLEPEALPLDVLYEDGDILVVNKAPGVVVHPGAGNPSGTLVNAVLAHCPDLRGVGGELRPGIVHRLDKDTSGVLVIAKHDQAIRALQRQFKRREVSKVYAALALGALPQDEGLIDAPLGRHSVHRRKMAVVGTGGKPARTRWRVTARLEDAGGRAYTLADVDLLTGRTHQIRVHFAWLGYPLAGDTVYGPARQPLDLPRQFLHARDLTLVHPATGETLTFSAPLPDDLARVLERLHPAVLTS